MDFLTFYYPIFFILICKGQANGWRYWRWGGRGSPVRLEKTNSVEKCLKMAPSPQRPVHALLGAVLILLPPLISANIFSADGIVSSMRFARVSGFLALTIHSKAPRFTERGNATGCITSMPKQADHSNFDWKKTQITVGRSARPLQELL
jgi:hypothetical protein